MDINLGVRLAGATMAIALAFTTRVTAHDFWIEPSTYDAAVNALVGLHLKVGEEFLGEPLTRREDAVRRFIAVGPGGSKEIAGRDGAAPAGRLRFDSPGLWLVAYESKPSRVQLAPAAFERYLVEEGLERIVGDRQSRGEATRSGRERFARSVKALIRVGGATDGRGHDRVIGLPLELIPERSPFSGCETAIPVRLLSSGAPLEGALVMAMRKDNRAGRPAEVVARTRTDREGRVVLPITPGVWLIKAVHMVRATTPGADWESVWTSLTFRVPE